MVLKDMIGNATPRPDWVKHLSVCPIAWGNPKFFITAFTHHSLKLNGSLNFDVWKKKLMPLNGTAIIKQNFFLGFPKRALI